MRIEVSIAAVGCALALSAGAAAGEDVPKTSKEAILRAVPLSVGHHVFDHPRISKTDKGRMCYDMVEIRATKLGDHSFRVVLSRDKPADTFTEVFAVEFPLADATTKTDGASSPGADAAAAEERRVCAAVQKVLGRHLTDEMSQVELWITTPVTQSKRKANKSSATPGAATINILVTGLPRIVDHITLFTVGADGEIRSEHRGP